MAVLHFFLVNSSLYILFSMVLTSHNVFLTHLEAIENLMNIEFPGVSWQSTGLFIT